MNHYLGNDLQKRGGCDRHIDARCTFRFADYPAAAVAVAAAMVTVVVPSFAPKAFPVQAPTCL